jgi:YHS domain-containing protein
MRTRLFLIAGIVCLLTTQAFSQTKEVFCTAEGAIKGYDVVAYFTEGKALKGSREITYKWNDADWYFISPANLGLFKANPIKYIPQFGGYCAYGVSENHKSPTTPEAFTIVNDKLYLNYNQKVKEIWVKNQQERINKADSNWVRLKYSAN